MDTAGTHHSASIGSWKELRFALLRRLEGFGVNLE